MKRLLMGFATCALIMASCSQQEIMENVSDGQGSLSFAAGVGKQSATRAAELNNDALKAAATSENGIVLYAYQKVGTTWGKWYNDAVVYDTKWGLKESVRFRNENETKYITYFPKSNKLTDENFENADFTTDKFPKFTYEVGANSKDQEDLIAGITEVAPKKTDITLGMRHILSQVNFGTVAYHGANILIQNIKIVTVKNKATFTYRDKDTYPIGAWTPEATTTGYDYYNYKNVEDVNADPNVKNNQHQLVKADATSGHKYIFGDGGNAGPGTKEDTWYPTSVGDGTWRKIIPDTNKKTGLNNSLMLLPQNLEDVKVTFEYRISDVSDVYVVGSDNTWEKGEFSLDFDKTIGEGKFYKGVWEQNYRYVYLIDFTDFLDGIALTFDVDVDMYPWENHDGDDGIIDIMAAGQPSAANMNSANLKNDATWYIATQNTTSPTAANWAQVIRHETWDLSAYDFKNINTSEKFTLSFYNVIFNTSTKPDAGTPTKITLTLPDGFSTQVVNESYIQVEVGTEPNTWIISKGNRTEAAAIVITNDRYYRTSADLATGIAGANENNLKFGYSGIDAIDLTTMQPTSQTTAKTLTVKFNCLILPTVGATTNGIWTWDAENRIATWKEVTWNNLDNTKTAVTGATANTVIYCNDETDIIDLATALGEPTTADNSPVKVVFSKAATRTDATTTNGAWAYDAAAKTATWTKTTTP